MVQQKRQTICVYRERREASVEKMLVGKGHLEVHYNFVNSANFV